MGDVGNAQLQPSVYTGPIGGFSCNTAGGYKLVKPSCWMTQQCMTDADLAAAEAACNAPNNPGSSGSQSGGGNPAPPPPLLGGAAPAPGAPAVAASSSIFDSAWAWVTANPMWAAAGAAVIVLLVVRR